METSFKYAAESNIYELNKSDREMNNTAIVEELIQQRQNLRDQGNFDAAKWMTKTIRKQVKTEKNYYRVKHFEEELWYDIKRQRWDSSQITQNS